MLKAPLDTKYAPFRSPITGRFVDEGVYDNHVSDIHHIAQTIEGLRNPTEHVDCPEDGVSCDCFSSEIVMLSSGYAEVWRDGDVVSGGVVIYNHEG
jgi:hypothetical protein